MSLHLLVVAVHGDDFTAVGPCHQLDWYEAALESKYEFKKGGRLGPGAQDDKEASCLNRIIRWRPVGLEYEADPRQIEKLIEELELDGANSCVTPGLKQLPDQIDNDQPLGPEHF